MASRLTPVDGDPFAQSGPKLTPIKGDPFAQPQESGGVLGFLSDIFSGEYSARAARERAKTPGAREDVARIEAGRAEDRRQRQLAQARDKADIGRSDGLIDRAGDFLKRGAAQTGSGLESFLSGSSALDQFRIPGTSDQTYQNQVGRSQENQGRIAVEARRSRDVGATPIPHETTFQDVKARPSAVNIGNFVLEQGVQSLPGMGTAIVSLPAYAASNAGQIGRQRAANDGREDATGSDLLTAAPAAVASAVLERIGLGRIAAPGVGNIAVRMGKAGLAEGATEAAQSGVEYAGGSAGTGQGFSLADMFDQMAQGALAGAPLGSAGHAVVDAPRSLAEAVQGARAVREAATMQPEALPQLSAPLEPVPQQALPPRTVVPKLTPIEGDPFQSAATEQPLAPAPEAVEPQPPSNPEPPPAATGEGLGQTLTPVPGDPFVTAPEAKPDLPPVATGSPIREEGLEDGEKYVRTPAGAKVRTRMEVVDASTLAKAEGAFQNRDRSRDTTDLQVQDIISKFDPELLGDDPSSDRGAPIVGQDHTVYSGNGRMLSLNKIFEQYPEKADAYRRFIESQGHSTEGVARPVLIRRITQDMSPDELRQFVVESNKDNKLEMSPVERARSDADAVTPEMLDRYAGGDLNSGSNSGFISDFTKKLTAGEMGNIIGSDRRLTTAGIERIENAVVAKAYDHPKLLEKLMESAHNEIRAITSSLANVAPAWAKMRAATKSGALETRYDITADLADAAMRVAEARKRGTKPVDLLTQADAFDQMSPTTEALIRAFYNSQMTRPASVKAVTEFLSDYIGEASAAAKTEGLFGEEPGKAPIDILKQQLATRDSPDGEGLFDRKEHGNGRSDILHEADRPSRSGRPAASGTDAEDAGLAGSSPSVRRGSGGALADRTDGGRSDYADDADATPRGTEQRDFRRADENEGSDARGSGRGRHAAAASDLSPADTSTGAYARAHGKGAMTDRPSDLRSAVEHLGMAWDDFNLKAAPVQMQLLQRAINDKLGIKVTVDHGELGPSKRSVPYRVAIDQMLDAFHNITGMAAVLGLPEKAMSLNGTLTLHIIKNSRAFYGAYYPGEEKIALPGRSNAFAHEWGHAFDYHMMGILARLRGNGGLSGLIRKAGKGIARPGVIAERFTDLLQTMFFDRAALATKIMELEAKIAATKSKSAKATFERQIERIKEGAGQHRTGRTDFYKKAKAFDQALGEPGGGYWQKPTEMLARSFEAYVAKKAADAGMSTEVISHADADYLSNADERLANTFPKDAERAAIFEAFDELFAAVADRKELGEGEAATVPTNPDRRAEPGPEQLNVFKRIVRNELGAFADNARAKEKAVGRPKDRKGYAQKANDIRHFVFSGMAAEMRALGNRHNSKAIARLHDLFVAEAGKGNRLQRRDFIAARRLRANRYANSIERALLDYGPRRVEGGTTAATILSKEQAADVRAMLTAADSDRLSEDREPSFPELKTLASRLREISDGIWHDLRAAGFDIGYTRNGHLQRIYDAAKAEADMAGFLDAATDVYGLMGLEQAEARKAAADWHFRLVSNSPMEFDQHQPQGDFLKGRALPPEADAIMSDFMFTEPVDLMRRYAEAAAHRIEWAKRFGVHNEALNALYEQMARERVDHRDVDTIRTMADIMAGRNPMRTRSPVINAAGAMFNTIYGTVALLPRAVFQSLSETITAGIVMENPAYGVMAFANMVGQALGTPSAKERRELVEFLGIVDTTQQTRLLADRFGANYDDPGSVQKINNKLFHNTGLIALTRAQMTGELDVANSYLIHLSHKLLKAKDGSPDQKEVLARFKEYGIRDPDGFAQWMAGHGGPSILHTTRLPSKAELAEGLDERGSAPWAFDWTTAVRRLGERVIQDPHAMTKPQLSHAGLVGKLVTGIQAFNYSFYENVLKAAVKRNMERAVDGRKIIATKALAATMAGFASLYAGALVQTTLRVFLTDRERWRDEEEKGTLATYLLYRTATQFIGNPLDPLVQMFAGLKYNRKPLEVLPGPAAGNFAANATDIITLSSRNSRKTNSAEHNAINGAYRLMSPWVAAAIGSVPGGPIVSGAEGVAQAYVTSPQAGRDVATKIVGPKNGRIGPDGQKIKSGPTAYDLFLDKRLGEVKRKNAAEP